MVGTQKKKKENIERFNCASLNKMHIIILHIFI